MNIYLRNSLIGIAILFVVLKITGVFTYYYLPSSSNEPNLPINSYIFGSNLIQPKSYDFAYFKFSDSLNGSAIVKRLIAMPGDRLECKNGEYFVNNKKLDNRIDLRFSYKVDKSTYDNILFPKFKDNESFEAFQITQDSYLVFLNTSFVKNDTINYKRYAVDNDKEKLSKSIFGRNKNWSLSNFGPIVLPKGKYFFSGDSRDNSYDSRHRGFVDENQIIGTVLFKI